LALDRSARSQRYNLHAAQPQDVALDGEILSLALPFGGDESLRVQLRLQGLALSRTPSNPLEAGVRKPDFLVAPIHDGPDPLGFGTKLAKIIAEMQAAYRAPSCASLHELLLVEFSPGSRRRMLDAPTARGGPVSFLAKIIMYPDDASGFRRAVGTLPRITGATPIAESDE
jgi:hypothetical protein